MTHSVRKKVIILDFDGVIVESVDIKNQAFSKVFSGFPDHHEEIMAYHFAHNTTDRYTKFRHIAEKILGLSYTEEFEDKVITDFNEYTRREIVACPYVPGAVEFLEAFQGRIPMYLASATPLDELKYIVEARNLAKFFVGILGAPDDKVSMFEKIQTAEGVSKEEMVFVGDSIGDMNSARESGVDFVARMNKDAFPSNGTPVFPDLFGIREYVERLV